LSLYVVATPIGNLLDMTQRAIQVLTDVDVIAAEDTRHSKSLLNHFGISTPLVAFHDHNEKTGSQSLVARMLNGDQVALVSDAGTPLISDPGYQLVRDAHAASITVVPIPGPTAMAAALSASGLATDSFLFLGFLPSKSTARIAKLQTLRYYPFSLVFYEAPHRIDKSISSMIDVFGGDRPACIAREMTKTFEQIVNGTLAELLAGLQSREESLLLWSVG
jgi:16S rRNA (cytidine1402-2'-O)-methyltransferase